MLEVAGIGTAVVGLILADHLAVAAERQRVEPIGRLATRPFDDRRTEADGEIADAHAEPLGENEVAELVERDKDAEDDEE